MPELITPITPLTPIVPLPAARPVEGREFLFATLDAGGHASPALSVARDLIARGHRVRMLGDPTLEQEIRAGGVEFVPWTRAPHRSPADPPKVPTSANPMREFARVRDELICGPADRFAADTRAEIARRRPDCVVADLLVPGVAIGAEADAIPCASLAMTLISAPGWGVPPAGPGFAPAAGPLGRLRDGLLWRLADRLWRKGVPALNRARAVNGLDGVGSAWEQVTRPERVLILSSAAFEFAGFDPPDNVALIGPRLDDPAWAGDWAPPPGDAPLLLVALSSDQMGQAPVLRRIAAGLAGLDVRAISPPARASTRRTSRRRPTSTSSAPRRTPPSCGMPRRW
jgi:UDP:flavonoid glycosyltransferase YjiC (YdhE family)